MSELSMSEKHGLLLKNVTRNSQSEYTVLEFLLARIRNKNTRETYFSALKQFMKWLESNGLYLESLSSVELSAYIEGHSGSASTIRLHLAAIRMLYSSLQISGQLYHNPALPVRAPGLRRERGKTPVLTADQVRLLLDGLAGLSDPLALRDRALIATMFFACPRISAVCRMRVGDYFLEGKRHKLRFTDKGDKLREIPCNHRLCDCLDDYLEEAGIRDDFKGPLFRVTRGSSQKLRRSAMSRHDAFRMIKRRTKSFGLPEGICNHSFRGSGLTVYLKNGGTLEKAQEIAGHSSSDTTRLYDRRNEEIMQAEVERITY